MRPPTPTHAVLVSGPPFASPLWTGVAERLSRALPCEVHDLLADPAAGPTVAEQARSLAAHATRGGAAPLLVAHGLAVPAAIRAAAQLPGARLVLCDGPIARLDPVSAALAALARWPGMLAGTLLQPRVLLPCLSSSAGLRRAVRNPYVMDRDTVVAVCGEAVDRPERRAAAARYLADLPEAVRSTPEWAGPTLLLWGDEDALYPASRVDAARLLLLALDHREVPGGRLLHPVERPWLVADAIAAWAGLG